MDLNKLGDNNSKENNVKLKLKEYFMNNKILTYENFNQFLEYIGLRDIWSTEKEQNFLWESITEKAIDKNNIDYDATQPVILSLFEEDDDKDISDMYIDNIDNLNIKLNESDNLNSTNSKMNLDNEKYIDEFINSINNNQDTLYYIRFINEIFFNKLCKDNKNVDYLNDEKIEINLDDILNKIRNNYKFININIEILKNYLNYINDNKNISNVENENNNYYLNKDLINYVNSIVDLKIEENNKNHNINLNNISNNNINGNSIEFSIEKLSMSDKNIINCLDGIISLNTNIDFIKLIKKYIENYILYLRQSIYNDLKSKELELQQKIIQSSNTCNKCNKDIDKEKKIFRKNTKLKMQKNKELSDTKLTNINEITTLRKSTSMPKKQKRKYTIIKKVPTEKDFSITTNNKTQQAESNQNNGANNKPKVENKIINGNKSITYSYIDNIEDITSSQIDIFVKNETANGDQFLLETTKLYSENIEDEDKNIASKNNTFLNNSKNISKSFIKNKIETEANGKKQKIINNNATDICSDFNNNENSFKINNDENSENNDIEDHSLNNNINNYFSKKSPIINTNDFFVNGNSDLRNSDINFFNAINSIDNCYGTYAYGPINEQFKFDFNKKFNLDDNIMNKKNINDFYDYEYLAYSHRIKRLFSLSNEKYNINKFFSQLVNAYFSKANKENCVLIITYYSIYFLKPDSLECILRLNIKILEKIIISSNNFNLLCLSFKGGIDIIIESFQRMEILIFLQKAITERNLENEIKINSSNKFTLRKKNKKSETILTFKNKMFNLTPNFENAQKIGILFKYQENLFSASFHKKLVALCSIGLIYFSDNFKTPKAIIPIIGTTIKPIAIQTNEKIYCLKLITINDETYIFGSLKKNEILDWKKELSNFKRKYDYQMKQINYNYSRKSTKFEEKENEDIFSKK